MQVAFFCLNVMAAVLAVWRITELMTQDRITDGIRRRVNTYLFSCHRCMSVWASMWAAGVFWAGTRWPAVNLLNYAAALAWAYLAHIDWAVQKRTRDVRRFTLTLDRTGHYDIRSDLTPPELQGIFGKPEIFNQIFNPGAMTAPTRPGPVPVPQPPLAKLSDEEIAELARPHKAAVGS